MLHVQRLGAETDLMLFHGLHGVGRAQQLAHLDCLPFFLRCQQSRVRVSQRAVLQIRANPAKEELNLVTIHPPSHVQQASAVLRSSTGWAKSGEGRTMQTGEGPVPGGGSSCGSQ